MHACEHVQSPMWANSVFLAYNERAESHSSNIFHDSLMCMIIVSL